MGLVMALAMGLGRRFPGLSGHAGTPFVGGAVPARVVEDLLVHGASPAGRSFPAFPSAHNSP